MQRRRLREDKGLCIMMTVALNSNLSLWKHFPDRPRLLHRSRERAIICRATEVNYRMGPRGRRGRQPAGLTLGCVVYWGWGMQP